MANRLCQIVAIALGFVALKFVGMAHSVEMRNFSLPEKVEESDAIFLATVKSLHTDSDDNGVVEFAILEISDVIKGQYPRHNVRLVTKGAIAENDPDCCEPGAKYLVFAQQRADGFYESANGIFGVYPVDGSQVIGWPDLNKASIGHLPDIVDQICIAQRKSIPTSLEVPTIPPTEIDEGD